ncbi:uncharacterized protein C16orf71 homolog [Camarhynchus parvulus]|uniref:uncharacterized protein C16orf71 homolog n=1 Tax=Geospiza parvula TaxID=87175 RepID=UPI001237C1FC|nr:uncharacterized protein C16orf71 homolog [Camarhynchus parvulus]
MGRMSFQDLPKRATVYIDLRDAEPPKPVTVPEEEQSASDSSSSSSSEEEEEETVTIQDEAERRMRNCSGKSLLLQRLRAARKEALELLHKTSVPAEKLHPERLEDTASSNKSQNQSCKVRQETNEVVPRKLMRLEPGKESPPFSSCGGDGADTEKENKMEAEKIPSAGNAPVCPLITAELPRREGIDRELSQKEEEMKERQRRCRLQEQLEQWQPQHSVWGKQPMAENTPLLFHREASFLPAIATLPGSCSVKKEVLLLTIWLASCGQVATDQCEGQVPDKVLGAANIYQALVTWLLSLVPPVKRKDGPKAPFEVVGLQQAWTEEGLALYACLVAPEEPSAQSCPQSHEASTAEHLQGTSSFYQKISAFLMSTWLPDLIWWRDELASRFQNQLCPLVPAIPSVLLSNIITVNPDPQAVEKAFAVPKGFYWQTVESDDKHFPDSSAMEACRDTDIEVAMVLLFEALFQNPLETHHTLRLLLGSGLDVCGLRLLYPGQELLLSSSEKLPSSYTSEPGKVPPVLALGVRGPRAHGILQDITRGCGRAEPVVFLPLASRVHRELCLWFGGRAAGMLPLPSSSERPPPAGAGADEEKVDLQGLVLPRPPAMLVSTTKGLMEELAEAGPGSGHSLPPAAAGEEPSLCFHGAPYAAAALHSLGGNLSVVPEPHPIPLDFLCHRAFAAEPGMEQVVMLTLVGMQALKSAGELLQQILLPPLRDQPQSAGLELLGLKWLPHLTRCQAREVTPFEAGDTHWQSSLGTLTSSPVLVCALRGIDAFQALGADAAAVEAHCAYLTSGTALVLCLQRPNAVKKLMDLLGPEDPQLAQALDLHLWRAQYGTSTVQNGFYGSRSYAMAVQDVKLFFPEGLCCAQGQPVQEQEIHNLKHDPILSLAIRKQHKILTHEPGRHPSVLGSEQPGSPAGQALLEQLWPSTCLVLPGLILRGSEPPPYVALLEELLGRGFVVTAARLAVLDSAQALCISQMLSRAKGSVAAKCSLLKDGLCLVLAAQWDSSVTSLDSLLDSACWQNQSVLDTAEHLLYPQNENQAQDLLCCFFDPLTSESIHRIEAQPC